MAWVGTVQALLRETNFDAPYLVNALKSVGEPVTGRPRHPETDKYTT